MSHSQNSGIRSEWEVESLRLTGFSPELDMLAAEKIWSSTVSNVAPDQSLSDRKNGRTEIRGELEDGISLILAVTQGRLDWVVTLPITELFGIVSVRRALGSPEIAYPPFQELMKKWLVDAPRLSRVALGSILRIEVSSRVEAYNALQQYLPAVTLDPENSSDFIYQINRKRSPVTDTGREAINRLSKWSAIQTAVQPIPSNATAAAKGQHMFFARLELDVNTAPCEFDAKAIPKQSLVSLLDELVDLSKEIASKGDVL